MKNAVKIVYDDGYELMLEKEDNELIQRIAKVITAAGDAIFQPDKVFSRYGMTPREAIEQWYWLSGRLWNFWLQLDNPKLPGDSENPNGICYRRY